MNSGRPGCKFLVLANNKLLKLAQVVYLLWVFFGRSQSKTALAGVPKRDVETPGTPDWLSGQE